jgi:membrane protein
VLILLVLGSRAFGALSRALNIAYEGEETGSLARRITIEIAMMLAVALLFICTLFSHYLVLFLWNAVSLLPGETEPAYAATAAVIRVLLVLLAFFLIYRFVPRKSLHWKSIVVGTVIATSLLIAARPLFYGYVQNLANYNLMYGGIAIAVVLLVWGWVAALITILGGEMASHFQTMVLEGAAPQSVDRKRMHLKSVKGNKDARRRQV